MGRQLASAVRQRRARRSHGGVLGITGVKPGGPIGIDAVPKWRSARKFCTGMLGA